MAKIGDVEPLAWSNIKHIVSDGPTSSRDLDFLENPNIVEYVEFNLNMLAHKEAKCAFSRNPGIFIATSEVCDKIALLRW